jgi:hypothetical protein
MEGDSLALLKNCKVGDKNDMLSKAIRILLNQIDEEKTDPAKSEIASFFANKTARDALFFIGKYLAFEVVHDYEPFLFSNFNVFITALLSHFSAFEKTLEFTCQEFALDQAESESNPEGIKVLCLKYGLFITNHLSKNSEGFCRRFIKTSGIKSLLDILNDEEFTQKNHSAVLTLWHGQEFSLIDYFLAIIGNLSQRCNDLKHLWTQMNASETLLKLIRNYSIETLADVTCIANLTLDKQLERPEMSDKVCKHLSRLLEEFSIAIGSSITRYLKFIFENQKRVECEVACIINEDHTTITLFEVLDVLYNLSLNLKLSEALYFGHNAKDCLMSILAKGNTKEILFAIRVVAQFSFYEKIAKDMSKDAGFVSSVNKLICAFVESIHSGKASISDDYFQLSIYNLCKQIKWNMHRSLKRLDTTDKLSSEEAIGSKKSQLFMSYHRSSKRPCRSIKNYLEVTRFSVFMRKIGLNDHDDRYGSDLNSMAKEIDQSACVLMLVSENYRQSVCCRAEAEFAYQANVPIVCLVLEHGYSASAGVGWLGDVMRKAKFVLNWNAKADLNQIVSLVDIINSFRSSSGLADSSNDQKGKKKFIKVSYLFDNWNFSV